MDHRELNLEICTNRTSRMEGTSFREIDILEYIGSHPERKAAYYLCRCRICAKEFTTCSTSINKSKPNSFRDGCKDCSLRVRHKYTGTHNMTGSKVHRAWVKIRERCYDKNNKSYADYGGSGILMDDDFIGNFLNFYSEVGDPPGEDFSIDRIDNTKGYVKGNMRWADKHQQARNKGLARNNTTGVTGVQWYWHEYPCSDLSVSKGSLFAVATWREVSDGKTKAFNKKFSVKKLGLLPAFAAAVEYRNAKIAELNSLGYGYSPQHGK